MALVVFTGGARSGKSSAAVKLAQERLTNGYDVTVVVFARVQDADEEMAERVARHRADRPEGFATIEATDLRSWRESVAQDTLLVVDCLGTALGQAMEAAWAESAPAVELLDAAAEALPRGVDSRAGELLDEFVTWLLARSGDTIVVTNEVGDGVVPTHASGRLFRDLLGKANRVFVARADAAYLVVAGQLVALDSLPRGATWPHD